MAHGILVPQPEIVMSLPIFILMHLLFSYLYSHYKWRTLSFGCTAYKYFPSLSVSSVTQSCPTLCDPMNRSTPGLPVHHNSRSSLKLMSIESVMPSNHLILCRPLFLLPPVPPSIRVFSNESTLHMRWPKSWSFSFRVIPSKEHPVLISFRMDWLALIAVQGTLRVFSNTTVQKHQFFGTQPSSQSNSHIHTWPLEKP